MSDSPVERENLTAALVRDLDDEALVVWIHALQDHGEAMEAEVERLREAFYELERYADDAIGTAYGTLSASFVRGLVSAVLAGEGDEGE